MLHRLLFVRLDDDGIISWRKNGDGLKAAIQLMLTMILSKSNDGIIFVCILSVNNAVNILL
jgi:hypothetical protein